MDSQDSQLQQKAASIADAASKLPDDIKGRLVSWLGEQLNLTVLTKEEIEATKNASTGKEEASPKEATIGEKQPHVVPPAPIKRKLISWTSLFGGALIGATLVLGLGYATWKAANKSLNDDLAASKQTITRLNDDMIKMRELVEHRIAASQETSLSSAQKNAAIHQLEAQIFVLQAQVDARRIAAVAADAEKVGLDFVDLATNPLDVSEIAHIICEGRALDKPGHPYDKIIFSIPEINDTERISRAIQYLSAESGSVTFSGR